MLLTVLNTLGFCGWWPAVWTGGSLTSSSAGAALTHSKCSNDCHDQRLAGGARASWAVRWAQPAPLGTAAPQTAPPAPSGAEDTPATRPRSPPGQQEHCVLQTEREQDSFLPPQTFLKPHSLTSKHRFYQNHRSKDTLHTASCSYSQYYY